MPKDKNLFPVETPAKPLALWFIFVFIPIYTGGFFALFLFPVARDWRWLEGWLFLITFVLVLTVGYFFINRENPRVLRNRMKLKKEGLTSATKKSAGSDRFIIPFMGIAFFGALILPGLDHRFGWSAVPFWVVVSFLLLTNLGVALTLLAMYQNPFASKILDINQGQELVYTGLYARVRHPLYAGAILMIIAMPLALGSWWGLVPAFFAALSLVVRIHFEEEMLDKGMQGYLEYKNRVRYKLFPGIY